MTVGWQGHLIAVKVSRLAATPVAREYRDGHGELAGPRVDRSPWSSGPQSTSATFAAAAGQSKSRRTSDDSRTTSLEREVLARWLDTWHALRAEPSSGQTGVCSPLSP